MNKDELVRITKCNANDKVKKDELGRACSVLGMIVYIGFW
jgi:hypothetical protein